MNTNVEVIRLCHLLLSKSMGKILTEYEVLLYEQICNNLKQELEVMAMILKDQKDEIRRQIKKGVT